MLEATRDLPSCPSIPTPLEPFAAALGGDLVAIPVLRAGLGLLDAVTDLYPDTVVGYLGMERDEHTRAPRLLREAPADGRTPRAAARSDARHRRLRDRRRPHT